jgi:hypothetical protein
MIWHGGSFFCPFSAFLHPIVQNPTLGSLARKTLF